MNIFGLCAMLAACLLTGGTANAAADKNFPPTKIMERVGAKPIKAGDAGYELEFLKGLQVQLILWEGDDEFPPSAQILFSDNFPVAFTQGEDMAVVGDVVNDMLKALSK